MQSVFNEGRHAAEFLMSEGPRAISRDNITIAASQSFAPGTLLAALSVVAEAEAEVTVSPDSKGAMTLASPAVSAAVKDGVYKVVCIEPASDAGTFEVYDPAGVMVGVAKVGVAFAGEIKFTIADGGTDFAAGDVFEVTVSLPTSGGIEYVAHDPDAADGSQVPSAIALYGAETGADETVQIAAITRQAEVNGNILSWAEGITADQKADAIQALARRSIIVR